MSFNKHIKLVLGVLTWLIISSWSSKDSYVFYPKATYYYAKDNTFTASGEKVIPKRVKSGNDKWIAVSRDFINTDFAYGDTVIIESKECPGLNGEWVIQDIMHEQWTNKIDFLIHKDNVKDLKFYNPHKIIMKKKK